MGLIDDAMKAVLGDSKAPTPAELEKAAQDAKRVKDRQAWDVEVRAKMKADSKRFEETLRAELRKPAKERNAAIFNSNDGSVDGD